MNEEEYIEKWLNDTLSDEEKAIFEQTSDFKSLMRLTQSLELFKAPDYDSTVEFDLLKEQMREKPAAKVVSLRWLKPLMRVAAVFLIAISGYFLFLYDPATSIKTLAGETKDIVLPDESTVVINAVSKLSYRSKEWASSRVVQLEGEAFFHVSKGARFDVQTEQGTISVLGTQFNVKSRRGFFEVVCYEGRVRVSSTLRTAELSPGKSIRMIGEIISERETSESTPTWRNDESTFESVPYEQVLNEFERQYDVTIETKGVDLKQLFTGRFTHSDITLSMKSISIPLNLNYEYKSDKKTVLLSGEDN